MVYRLERGPAFPEASWLPCYSAPSAFFRCRLDRAASKLLNHQALRKSHWIGEPPWELPGDFHRASRSRFGCASLLFRCYALAVFWWSNPGWGVTDARRSPCSRVDAWLSAGYLQRHQRNFLGAYRSIETASTGWLTPFSFGSRPFFTYVYIRSLDAT